MLTPHKRLQVYSFLFLLLVGLTVVFFLLRPFFNVLAASFILAVMFRPLYEKFLVKVKMPSFAAFLTIFCMLAILLIPLWFLGQMVFGEAVGVYQNVKGGDYASTSSIIQELPPQVRNIVNVVGSDLNRLIGTFTGNAFAAFSKLVSNIAGFLLSFFLVLFTVFYWLKDGHRIKQALIDLSPIANSQENILFEKVTVAVNGVVKGTFIVALVQGFVASVGFWVFGIPNPALWGCVTVLAALVPTVGTALATIPAVLYLVLSGSLPAALGMTAWGVLAVGLVDNFIGPRIVGRAARVHPVLILFSILGGISLFGFLGFLLGPILMAIFVAMVDMYRNDFKNYLED